ncbi:permease [Geomonas sp.]|uniref:permease n=1 Tax=Geomonas sp. TaxID=2651584 RepID=UPI002B468CFE|nr:permease [Geomonas sp.]HJV35329.1 permease [Geomonas sp.]
MLATIFWTVTTVAVLVSWWRDSDLTKKALQTSWRSLMALVPKVLGMIALVGLVLALVPQEVLTRLFTFKGVGGFALVSLVGAVVTMPAPIAFPLAGSLLGMGAAPAALAAFITTLTMVGIVSAPIEVSYFGVRFTLLRQSLSFVAAILIGLLMGVFL